MVNISEWTAIFLGTITWEMCVNFGVHSEIFWFKFMTKNGKYFGVDCDIFGYNYMGNVCKLQSALQNFLVQIYDKKMVNISEWTAIFLGTNL